MRAAMASATGMTLVLGLCAGADAPQRRQPGSWTQTAEVLSAGKDARLKADMQKMFDAASAMTFCVTPETAAGEDLGDRIAGLAPGLGGCTFAKREISGGRIDIAATCQVDDEKPVQLRVTGTVSPVVEDVIMSVERTGDGPDAGVMTVHSVTSRRGECTDRDVQLPSTPAK